MTRSRCRAFPPLLVGIALIVLGCAPHHPPGTEDLPPGVAGVAATFTDINPRWSHDGRRIAFIRAGDDRRLQLFITAPDLDRPLALLEEELVSPDRPYSPELNRYCGPDTLAWSPNDRKIAFERIEWFTFENGERLPGTGLWEIDLHSGRVLPLAIHKSIYNNVFYYYHTPCWSPDGRYLAFVGEGINGQRAIFVRPLSAEKAQEVQPRFDNYGDSDWPAWQPLAGLPRIQPALAFRQGVVHALAAPNVETLRRLRPGGHDPTERGEIWRLHAAEYARLLSAEIASNPIAARAAHLQWEPNGRRLAYSLTPDANDFTRYEIWVIGDDGRAPHRVSPHDGHGYFAPVWIGASRIGALSPHGDAFDVVVIDLQSRSKRVLGTISSADCDWSPDRTRIAYAPSERVAAMPGALTTLRLFDTHLAPLN
jgi:Tol biopolymer transport system component